MYYYPILQQNLFYATTSFATQPLTWPLCLTVGPLADPQALQDDFIAQHKVVEKLCSDYTAKLRSAGV